MYILVDTLSKSTNLRIFKRSQVCLPLKVWYDKTDENDWAFEIISHREGKQCWYATSRSFQLLGDAFRSILVKSTVVTKVSYEKWSWAFKQKKNLIFKWDWGSIWTFISRLARRCNIVIRKKEEWLTNRIICCSWVYRRKPVGIFNTISPSSEYLRGHGGT